MSGEREPACEHLAFEASVGVHRLTETDGGPVVGYRAEVVVSCAACGRPFAFGGCPVGYDVTRPTVSADRLTLRAPIVPTPGEDARFVPSTTVSSAAHDPDRPSDRSERGP